MDCSEPSSSRAGSSEPQSMEFSDEIQWRFSQIKGNIETDDAPTDGFFNFSLAHKLGPIPSLRFVLVNFVQLFPVLTPFLAIS
ncbi:unnamed protein product [Meloidogyne enterolobii]|uniref:Uncharacterized protein n=1 Tax=Meloidogyne enterolobii TaxID=390850 RepID=A0ACB0Z3F6_MELEN